MAPRTRARIQTVKVGTRTRSSSPGTVVSSTLTNNRETITDQILPGNGHSLLIDRFFHKGVFPCASGTFNRAGDIHTYIDFPVPRICDVTWSIPHLAVGGVPTLASAAAEIVAATNPSRPLLDVPVFAKELRDIPGLLFKRSNDLGRDLARGRLSLEYGWKPLIRDLKNLLDFKKAFADRVREIEHVRRTGLRRKRTAFNGSSTPAFRIENLDNYRGFIPNGRLSEVTTVKVDVFVRWRPDGVPPRFLGYNETDYDIHATALRALTGMNDYIVDPSTIWEVLPFSWLADWCTNAGDYLAAHRNIVKASPDKIQVMVYSLTEQKVELFSGGDIGFGALSWTSKEVYRYHETKTREPVSLTLDAHMPFLKERQVAILSDIVRNNFPHISLK